MVLCRFCSKHDSTHIGTRKRSSIQDIKEDSDTRIWMDERKWKSISNKIKKWGNTYFMRSQRNERWNTLKHSIKLWTNSKVLNEVDEYCQHSKYVIDPCKFKFWKVLRILSLIKKSSTYFKWNQVVKLIHQKSNSKHQGNFLLQKKKFVKLKNIFSEKQLSKKSIFWKKRHKQISQKKEMVYFTIQEGYSAITAAGKMTANVGFINNNILCACYKSSFTSRIEYSKWSTLAWRS